jgi:hypothetical protein
MKTAFPRSGLEESGRYGIRDRLRRLERASEGKTMTLVCPECGEEFIAAGDVAVEFLVHDGASEARARPKSYRQTPEDILRIFEHEHKPSNFVEKTSGEPFLGPFFSGMDLGVAPEDVEDLSE